MHMRAHAYIHAHTRGASSQLVAIMPTYGRTMPYISYLLSTCFRYRANQ